MKIIGFCIDQEKEKMYSIPFKYGEPIKIIGITDSTKEPTYPFLGELRVFKSFHEHKGFISYNTYSLHVKEISKFPKIASNERFMMFVEPIYHIRESQTDLSVEDIRKIFRNIILMENDVAFTHKEMFDIDSIDIIQISFGIMDPKCHIHLLDKYAKPHDVGDLLVNKVYTNIGDFSLIGASFFTEARYMNLCPDAKNFISDNSRYPDIDYVKSILDDLKNNPIEKHETDIPVLMYVKRIHHPERANEFITFFYKISD